MLKNPLLLAEIKKRVDMFQWDRAAERVGTAIGIEVAFIKN